MEELLSLKESIVTYLDRSGGLRKLVEACQSFKDSQQVYRFSFDVNPSDIVELDAKLGDCVLHDPLKATALFQSVCFLSIKTLSLIEHIHTENQVNVVLLPTHMPPFPSYILDLSEFPRGYYLMRPVALEGLVIAMTCVTKYTQGARFICTEEKCPCSRGFHHIRVHAPGATESATVRSDFICFLCSSPLKEDVKSRVLGDELCNAMNIGQLYHVVGIPAHVHQSANITWAIEACRIQNLMPEYPSSISENFQALHAASACSPWRFSAIVANSFGSPVLPPGLYNTLKLVLLLSLVQTKEENLEAHNHLDVLALTGNTLTVERLMTYSLGLAARGIRHTVTGELFASLSRDEHGAGTANIHAGSAFLAAGGVCLLGDLTCYKKDKIDTLQSALDSRAVSVFIPGKKYGEDAEQLLSFPINCNFWALADALTPSKKANRPDSVLLGSVEIGPVPPQLVDAFGLVIQCREPVGNHLLNPMIVHTLRQAISPGEPVYPACMQFTTQDYKELLAYARNLNVGLSTEAEKMIHGYYMASRRVRFSGSVTSMKVLLALAEAHAKLNLRSIVLEEDAVIAVLLCENSITLRHGASTLVIPPDAVFPCDLCDLESLHRRDLTLKEFHQQILQFVYNYAPGAANYIMEE
ncbi:minichromosome maintenance domain-containing protein 2 isoform X2 [Silurus meridionalis]|uniref:minichromosome maintenance domain-containing protein 2 isoform X2 n=1 Tax=Silurus meridionalis TaxID=175797 RepID=UPI001EEC734E|nr:minichromosome maintenance domain-containing protein 2 isoform X2 [Silurus meridionalis]